MTADDKLVIPGAGETEPDAELCSWLETARNFIDHGNLGEAEEIYRWLIGFGVQHEKVLTNLAAICQLRGGFDESLVLLNQALILKPESLEANLNLANVLEAQGDYKAAVSQIQQVLALDGHHAEAHHNHGFLLSRLKNHSGAIEAYRKALELKPFYPDAYNNLGNSLQAVGDVDGALDAYRKALELKPCYPDAYNNLGNALKATGDFDGALAAYEQAISQKPELADVHLNRALLLLLLGEYELGWEEYAWRLSTGLPHAVPATEIWRGDSAGKSGKLLLICEQGLGDSIQMLRYLNILRQQGHQLQLAVQESLHTIVSSSGIDPAPISPEGLEHHHEGSWLPLFSLPGLLGVTPEHPVASPPYLHCPEELVGEWGRILSAERRPIIAINWQGNPLAEQTEQAGRSFELQLLAPLASGFEGSLVSLQKGFGSEQLNRCSFVDRFVSCQDQVNSAWDFLDIAAIILNTELLITSDTCVAHLAGALGHPTWLLVSRLPDWRWGLNGDTSFWYPSMRLFRQSSSGDWAGVIERVRQALQELEPSRQTTG